MLRGEAIAWIYGLVMLEAVALVEVDLATKSKETLRSEYEQALRGMAANPASLPHPKKCSNPLHCERRPQCFTNYEPLFEPSMALAAISVGTTGWKYAPGE
jgi:hypothetical protein